MRNLLVARWLLVVVMHFGLIISILSSFFVLPFYTPWYIAIPLCSLIFRLIFSRDSCAITELENTYRVKLGWPRIRGFVGHYILRPIRRCRRMVLANHYFLGKLLSTDATQKMEFRNDPPRSFGQS